MEKIKVLVIGGKEKEFHDFVIMGPIFQNFLEEAGFEVTLSEDLNMFLPKNIAKFDVILCYTTGQTLKPDQEAGLLNAIIGSPWGHTGKSKGFIGVHCASCSFLNSQAYLQMLGGKFLTHPPIGELYNFKIVNQDHPIMKEITDFSMIDELYLLETYSPFETLITCDFQGFIRPVAWAKPYGLGRVFYTALGHGEEQTKNQIFQKMIINAISWSTQKK